MDDNMAGFVPGRWDASKRPELNWPALAAGVRVGVNSRSGATYPAALIGALAPGTGDPVNGMVIASQDRNYPRALVENPGVLAAPRFGFAFDPFGNGKTALRGGAGVTYQRMLGWANSSVNGYPIVESPTIQYGSLATYRSAQGYVFPPIVLGWDRHMKAPSTLNMSFSIQRHVGFGAVVDVGYVGSLGRHLFWERSLQGVPVGARYDPVYADPANRANSLPDVFLRPRTGYNDIDYFEGAATSNYHSLQIMGARRFARSLQFGANYTWSKVLDAVDSDTNIVTTVVSPRRWYYGRASFDRTHVLKANWLWDLPKVRWSFAPARAVLNGWQMSGIGSFSTGAPIAVGYSLVTAIQGSGTPSLAARIVVTGNPALPRGERTFNSNFRTDVFQPPAPRTLGNAGKTQVVRPGINNWDIAAMKNFPIGERLRGQFRGQFFNAFNHSQFSAFDATARFDAQGRQINAALSSFTAARNPRMIELALRVSF